jgi:hypothetical protein
MREQAMRYCLIALIVALAGMYFYVLEPAYPGFLPPATPQELEAYHVEHQAAVAAFAGSRLGSECDLCPDAANSHPSSTDAESALDAYSPCDAPVAAGPATFDFDF